MPKPIKKPLPPKQVTHLSPITPPTLTAELIITNAELQDGDYENITASYCGFDGAHVSKTNFSGANLKNFEVQDTIFDHCDFSNAELIGSSFHRTIFKNCKLTGTNFAEGLLADCQFIDCLADFSVYSYGTYKIVSFSGTSLREADFFELTWQHLNLDDCDLTSSSWFNTPLNGLNLTRCRFDKIAVSPERIRGLIVNQAQSVPLVLSLGVSLDEPL